jgi:hypothetical protein
MPKQRRQHYLTYTATRSQWQFQLSKISQENGDVYENRHYLWDTLSISFMCFIFCCWIQNYHVVREWNYRRGFNWWLVLLTTHPHDSKLQAITSSPLISTIHKSPQQPLSLFQPALSSSAVPWQRLRTLEIFQLHYFSLPYTTYTQAT